MKIIETKRLILRDFTIDDLESCHAYAKDPKISQYQSWGPNRKDETLDFLENVIKEQSVIPRKVYEFAVIEKLTSRHIGGAGLRIQTSLANDAAIGYSLEFGSWGRGYGTELTQGLIDFGFETLKLNRLWAYVLPANQASFHVLQKCGLRREGTMRQGLIVNNRFEDCYLYAMTADQRGQTVETKKKSGLKSYSQVYDRLKK